MAQRPSPETSSSSTGFYIGIAVLSVIGAAGLFMVIYAVGTTIRDRFVSTTPTTVVQSTQNVIVTQPQPAPTIGGAATQPQQPTQASAPTQPQPPTSTQPSGPSIKVKTAGFFRSGPGTNYEVLGSMAVNEEHPIVGRTQDGSWVAVQYTPTRVVWIATSLVEVQNGVIGGIPVRNTPAPPATATPIPPTPVPATFTPIFTATSAAPVANTVKGIRGDFMRLRSTSVGVNGEIWFDFQVTNTSSTDTVAYNGLGPVVVGVKSKPSWGDSSLGPNQVLPWADHFEIGTAGNYTVYLGICFLGSRSACETNNTGWQLLVSGGTIEVK
ncbi:MAG: hypothetical protein HZC38_08820 [Chloroflexi bacterium]|nr:hypothetical protein [Chloroflexota bacterium]MBI5080049.1 hypothetical protein [Chloroflexota bacterium]MBI5349816.1 hypothetical protein [Chloroflexota bacterium]MBI5713506.1 hypothetical protein [Chloroflexota bacterium]